MHPASCKNPDTCRLSYVEHLRGFVVGCAATPTRGVHRTPGKRDEPVSVTLERVQRWDRENDAYRQLAVGGHDEVAFCDAPRVLREMGG